MAPERVKEKVKLLLGNTAPEGLAEYAADLACDAVCNYCNLPAVPPALENTAAAMAVEAYRRGQYGAEQMEAQAKSVSRGDTSYTFSNPAELMQRALETPGFAHDFAKQLNAFRRLR